VASAILYIRAGTEPQQQRHHFEASCTASEMYEGSSGKTARGEGGLTLDGIHHEANQPGAARLNHAYQQSDENRPEGRKFHCECESFIVMAGGNCADRVIQGALRRPTGGQFLMLGLGSHSSDDISGTLQEELTQRLARSLIEGSRF
jgi:hypothetical protein